MRYILAFVGFAVVGMTACSGDVVVDGDPAAAQAARDKKRVQVTCRTLCEVMPPGCDRFGQPVYDVQACTDVCMSIDSAPECTGIYADYLSCLGEHIERVRVCDFDVCHGERRDAIECFAWHPCDGPCEAD